MLEKRARGAVSFIFNLQGEMPLEIPVLCNVTSQIFVNCQGRAVLCFRHLGNLNWSLLRGLKKLPIFVTMLEFLKTHQCFGQNWAIIVKK